MSAASDYLENAVLNHVLGGATYTPPTLSVALFTADDGLESGTVTSEIGGGSYARQSIAFTVTGNQATNTATVQFPTASAAWGTITHVAVVDGSSNVLFHGAVTTPKNIDENDTFQISASNLTISLD